jgi:hypothetical protein
LHRRAKWSAIASGPNEHRDEISRYVGRDEIEVVEEDDVDPWSGFRPA